MVTIIEDRVAYLEKKHPILSIKLKSCLPLQQVTPGTLVLETVEPNTLFFLYRMASLASLKELHKFLDISDVHLVILEHQIEEMAFFMSQEDMEPLLKHPNCEWYLLEDLCEEVFLKWAWQSVFFKYTFLTLFEDPSFLFFKEHMTSVIERVFLIASEYRDYGKRVFKNFYENLSLIEESKRACSVKFPKIPAVICGGGPSLEGQKSLLKQLEHRALLFVGGSTISAFSKWEITPQVIAIVDPEFPYERAHDYQFYETPCVYQLRASAESLRLIHGEKLVSAGSGEFPFESYYFKMSKVESGWNVANFMATLAAEMGCDPIILVGVDMMYQENQEYAEGVGALEKDQYKHKIAMQSAEEVKMFSRKDLLMGKKFFSELPQRYPQSTFFNATERGLFIEQMKHVSLEEISASLELRYDLQGIVHQQLAELDKISSQEGSFKQEIREELSKSFNHTQQLIQDILRYLEKLYAQKVRNRAVQEMEMELLIAEMDLEQECVYLLYIEPVWQVWKWLLFRHEQHKIHTVEGAIRKILFFKEVVQTHEQLFHEYVERT